MTKEEWHEIHGAWSIDDLRRVFVAGAKWWEFHKTGGTMFYSDQRESEEEAEKRYPEGKIKELPYTTN